ncbi:MAG: prepilin-type N-terminal cleavage/methylation domain-containing protein [Candidatus Aerophobus sp.]|nr:MAG: prepilin-type N-terminal cleavage/methylation domain-containing protein [Candidatus Aerophobus sp.]
MKKLFRKKEGFTLIELLIVVAIIGIIAGIAIPNFLGARSKARVTRAFADMRAIADALEMYYVDNTTYPAALADLKATHITSLPNDPFSGAVYRYYINDADAPTAWLLVSNGPDGDEDVAEDAISWADADRIAGQLGGSDGADEGYGLDDEWSDGSAGSTGDLGRGGP